MGWKLNKAKYSTMIRNEGIHSSAIMLLNIVDYLETTYGNYVYISEVEGFYKEHRSKRKNILDYSYSGIYTMLRRLASSGYLSCKRDGKRNTYHLTPRAVAILDAQTEPLPF